MVATATEFSGVNPTVRNAGLPMLQYGLFDDWDGNSGHASASTSVAAVSSAPGLSPAAMVCETADQVRTRLCQDAERKAELKIEEASSAAASDSIIEKLSITLRRIRNFSDEQLLERAIAIPLAN